MLAIVVLLIRGITEFEDKRAEASQTALIKAAQNNNTEMIKLLLDASAI